MARIEPFSMSAIVRGEEGIKRYENRPRSLIEMLRQSVDAVATKEAIVEVGGEGITFGDLWDRAARVAGGLRDLGIKRGERLAIRLGNGVDWCLAFFGTLMAGAIVVPINTRLSEPEVDYIVGDSGSKFVFEPQKALPQGRPLAAEDLRPDDAAAIWYTSGTTGFPKGALLTHLGFLSNIETCRRINPLPFDGSLRSLISVPLFHVTGCNSQLLPALEARDVSVIMPTFQVQSFLQTIAVERISVLTSVPAVYWFALNQPNFRDLDTKAIRFLCYGGAPIAPDLVEKLLNAFPNARLGNGFGLTETSSVATFLPHEYARIRPETVGFAAPVVDVDVEIVDAATGVGELLVRGPNVVKGYWNKPEASAEAFVNGWLRTGDLARIDEDGFIQIVDRKKDMVNRGGENVYCVEVENVLSAHPAVLEVAVMGVPDEMMGEKVGAVVVVKPGHTVEAAEILEFAKDSLADFKRPQYLVIRSEMLPRNPGGKIMKGMLRNTVQWAKVSAAHA